MVLTLGATLDLPMREQNALLRAADFEAAFDEPRLDAAFDQTRRDAANIVGRAGEAGFDDDADAPDGLRHVER